MNAKIIIEVEEGLVQNVFSNVPVDFLVVDRDVEGTPEKELIKIPRPAEAFDDSPYAHRPRLQPATVAPEYVEQIHNPHYR